MLAGTLSIYLGEPHERCDVPAGSIIHVKAGTALQSVNHGDDDLIVYARLAAEDHRRAPAVGRLTTEQQHARRAPASARCPHAVVAGVQQRDAGIQRR